MRNENGYKNLNWHRVRLKTNNPIIKLFHMEGIYLFLYMATQPKNILISNYSQTHFL